MRSGLIINPCDLSKRWIDRVADNGITVLGIHSDAGVRSVNELKELVRQNETESYRALIDYAKERNVEIEYELHAAGYLVPRELFDTHPEYFRVNKDGERSTDFNFCVTNTEALSICAKRAAELALSLYGSCKKFNFWMDDSRDVFCHCKECRKYSPSDQTMIALNAMIAEIRKYIPDAQMPFLAYLETLAPPTKVKASDGIFLEYAPFAKYTAVGEDAEERVKNERDALAPLLEYFAGKENKVLEYWFDNSIFSGRVRPPKYFALDVQRMRRDVVDYANLGFVSMTSFACFLGEDYFALHGDFDVKPYADALSAL